uniref:Uncharacterized protein n=1 Tax=Sphaerodactylus townsendi TaxID=933632 RepID=A0ACB8EM75_9SAUR
MLPRSLRIPYNILKGLILKPLNGKVGEFFRKTEVLHKEAGPRWRFSKRFIRSCFKHKIDYLEGEYIQSSLTRIKLGINCFGLTKGMLRKSQAAAVQAEAGAIGAC